MLNIGFIKSSHGVRGLVKIKSLAVHAEDIFVYDELFIEDGENFKKIEITKQGISKDLYICNIDGVNCKNESDSLKGKSLFVNVDENTLDDGEFYLNSLIGFMVVQNDGKTIGNVVGYHDFGAGDIMEILLNGEKYSEMFIFNEENFPDIDFENKKIIFIKPQMV